VKRKPCLLSLQHTHDRDIVPLQFKKEKSPNATNKKGNKIQLELA
jgi:hypothetical protein